jgi:hypothetical protein
MPAFFHVKRVAAEISVAYNPSVGVPKQERTQGSDTAA